MSEAAFHPGESRNPRILPTRAREPKVGGMDCRSTVRAFAVAALLVVPACATAPISNELLGAGSGIGAGVTGIRIDDVNNDGVKEIWCTDAIGHVYLFRMTNGNWSCFYRSTDLGACPGLYNQIYVMKNSFLKTTKLILLSSGYVMVFTVNPSML